MLRINGYWINKSGAPPPAPGEKRWLLNPAKHRIREQNPRVLGKEKWEERRSPAPPGAGPWGGLLDRGLS